MAHKPWISLTRAGRALLKWKPEFMTVKERFGCEFLHLKKKEKKQLISTPHLSVLRWSKKLAEQVSHRRPQLPGGSQLCLCAHWPLLKKRQQVWCYRMWKNGGWNEDDGHARKHTRIPLHTHWQTHSKQTNTRNNRAWRRPRQCWTKERHQWSLRAVL